MANRVPTQLQRGEGPGTGAKAGARGNGKMGRGCLRGRGDASQLYPAQMVVASAPWCLLNGGRKWAGRKGGGGGGGGEMRDREA